MSMLTKREHAQVDSLIIIEDLMNETDMRFGQIVANSLPFDSSMFYVSDEMLAKYLREYSIAVQRRNRWWRVAWRRYVRRVHLLFGAK